MGSENICPAAGEYCPDVFHAHPTTEKVEHGKFPSVERPLGIAPRLAVDALGYVWRVFDDGMWSMAPVNPDNSPVPEPVTWYYPENPCEGCGAPFRPEHHIYGSTKCCPDCSHYNKPTTEKVEGE